MEELTLYLQGSLQTPQAAQGLQRVNHRLTGHGLTLRQDEILQLAERHRQLLQTTGRVEFGEGILPQLDFAFADSPHIAPADYAATLDALLECFYHYKNETREAVSDDELLCFMKTHFDGACNGSLDYLAGTLLEQLAERLRGGMPVAQALAGGTAEDDGVPEDGGLEDDM